MYSTKPHIVYGFHATNKADGIRILNEKSQFEASRNAYDWLGKGIYFWENGLKRVWQYADLDSKRPNSRIKEPFVLGVVLELGNCLDLLDQKYIDLLAAAHEYTVASLTELGRTLPENKRTTSGDFDFKRRELDCAVINQLHEKLTEEEATPFDTVRAAFLEGQELYPGAGFKQNNHIQIAVINRNCIKGIFLPRERENHSEAW